MTSKVSLRLIKLSGKPRNKQFNDEEISFLKKHVTPTLKQVKVHYCFYSQKSSKGLYVGFVIDFLPSNPRGRTPAHYSMEVFCSRYLTKKEIDWEILNYPTSNRRFGTWWYRSINDVLIMDMNYDIETPIEFIKECNKRGYNQGAQLFLNV